MSEVYFISIKGSFSRHLLQKFEILINKAQILSLFKPNNLVACKLHFGEEGNINFVSPVFVKKIVELIKAKKGIPFLTDTCSLYVGKRGNAPSHIELAESHGFSKAPIIIADGLRGESGVPVKINLKHFNGVKIANSIYHADAMIVISHFKGHMETGFGGAIKNLGMGCSTREGKLKMHSDLSPTVSNKCKGCGICVKWCPVGAILYEKNKKSQIIESKCIGCGSCVAVCPSEAIKIRWKENNTVRMQEMMVEYAKAAIINKPVGYINFLTRITKYCDCAPTFESPIVSDIGILASLDPVSIDKASFDIVNKISNNKFKKLWPKAKPEVQLQYGEEVGLGTQNYKLIEIE